MKWIKSERFAWSMAVVCALSASGLDYTNKRKQYLDRKYIEQELITTRKNYYNLLESNRELVFKYSKLKSHRYIRLKPEENDSINITF